MVLEANAAHTMDINGHKQDDPRASQAENIARGLNHQATAIILRSYHAS